jgi:hypothetical protein
MKGLNQDIGCNTIKVHLKKIMNLENEVAKEYMDPYTA